MSVAQSREEIKPTVSYSDSPTQPNNTEVSLTAVLSHSDVTGGRLTRETTLDQANRKDRGWFQGNLKGMQTTPVHLYSPPRTHFPNDRIVDAQIRHPDNQGIPLNENRFALLPAGPEGREMDTEHEEKGESPYRNPTRKTRRRRRRKRHQVTNGRKTDPRHDTPPPPILETGTEEVSRKAEENHWIEQDKRVIASISTQEGAKPEHRPPPGCQAMIAGVMMLIYLDTGCMADGVIDQRCYKAMRRAGAEFARVPLTTRTVSASNHEIELTEAVQCEVVIPTRDGSKEAVLTFLIMKGNFILGAIIGCHGLEKLGMTVDCRDPRMQVLPREDGGIPRAHVLTTEVLARTADHTTIPPNSYAPVFVTGPICRTAVGSDVVTDPGLGCWAGLKACTLTTIRLDEHQRIGADVSVTNPSPDKCLIIPRGAAIARLNIHCRRVRAEQIAPGKVPAFQREAYTGRPPPLPVSTFTTWEEEPDSIPTETKVDLQEQPPTWMVESIERVAEEKQGKQAELRTIAGKIVTAMGDAVVELGPERASKLATTLLRHAEVFAPIRFDKVCVSDKLEPMRIPLNEGARVQSVPPRRLGYARRKMLSNLVSDMLRDGVVQPSSSPWAFPVVIAPKPDGSPRFCVDFRRLNDITRKDSYPLPRMDDLLDRLGEAKFRSVMDLTSGYWQLPMAKEDREKTAFITPDGLYEFLVVPFGLCNAPAHFQRAMNKVLAGMNFFFTCVYLDDVIVFSKTFEEHLDHLDRVLTRLEQVGLKVKLTKCSFCKKEIKYLGHIVSDEGVKVDPEKTDTVLKAPIPTNKKELRSFLGLLNYYRKFIDDYAAIAAPLSRLTGTKTAWEWGRAEQEAFDKLKACMVSAPVLAYPHPTRPIKLRTDASGYSIAGVLQQQQEDGSWHPIAFWSRSMRASEKGYAATAREGLAAVEMVKHFRPYLEGRDFELESDAKALTWILNKDDSNDAKLARWAVILKAKGVNICHQPGTKMADADGLSRYPIEEERRPEAIEEDLDLYSDEVGRQLQAEWDSEAVEHSTLATIIRTALEKGEEAKPPVGLQEIRDAQAKDDVVQRIRGYLAEPHTSRIADSSAKCANECVLIDGMLYRRDRDPRTKEEYLGLWIPKAGDLRERILTYGHGSITSGHSGIAKTVSRLRPHYYWPKMQTEVTSMVRQCHSCQIRKATSKDPGQVKSITVENPMDLWSVDLVGPLTRTDRKAKYILTMVDHFTRLADAIPITSKRSEEVARGILELALRHGTPRKILSDRGGEFQSRLTAALYQDMRLKGIRTSGYAPQTNGKVERFHRTLGNILSTLVSREGDDWDVNLPLAIFAYNTQVHSATGYTPFFLDHLREARHPWQEVPALPELTRTPGSWETEMMRKAAKVYSQVRRRLNAQRDKVEQQAEALKPMLQRIQPGDSVLVRIPKEVATKLGPKFEGPATVIRVWNEGVSYVVRWPSGMETTEHIRNIQKYQGQIPPQKEVREPQDPSRDLVPGKTHKSGRRTNSVDDGAGEQVVKSIEGKKIDPELGTVVYLVHWEGLSKKHRTWEPRDELMRKCSKLIQEFDRRKRTQRRKGREENSTVKKNRKCRARKTSKTTSPLTS